MSTARSFSSTLSSVDCPLPCTFAPDTNKITTSGAHVAPPPPVESNQLIQHLVRLHPLSLSLSLPLSPLPLATGLCPIRPPNHRRAAFVAYQPSSEQSVSGWVAKPPRMRSACTQCHSAKVRPWSATPAVSISRRRLLTLQSSPDPLQR